MKSFKEYLEEISKKGYADAVKKAGDLHDNNPHDEPVANIGKLLSKAHRDHGEKFGKDMEQLYTGSKKTDRMRKRFTNTDPLKSRKVGVTKQGKANKRDVEDLKGKMKDNIIGMRRASFIAGKNRDGRMPIKK